MADTLKEEEILANHDWNEDRTSAFVTTKPKRQGDSIGWMVWGLCILFFSIFSLGRITIFGQFFDDVIFNFLFGWTKYFIYLLLFFVDICIFSGVRFKFKKRFLFMIFSWFLIICWLISLIFYAYSLSLSDSYFHGVWQRDIFEITLKQYVFNWKGVSIFSSNYFSKPFDFFLKSDISGYFNVYSAGGLFGSLLTGIFSYTSIVGAYLIWIAVFLTNILWIFTGDPFYLFKPKNKRKGKALRILSLSAKKNPNIKKSKKTSEHVQSNGSEEKEETKNTWESINVFGHDEINIEEDIKTSDLTIQMPSYFKNEQRILLDNIERERQIEALEKSDPTRILENKDLSTPKHKFVSRRKSENVDPNYQKIPKKSITGSSTEKTILDDKTFVSTSAASDEEDIVDGSMDNSIDASVVGDDTFFNSLYDEDSVEKTAIDITSTFYDEDSLNKTRDTDHDFDSEHVILSDEVNLDDLDIDHSIQKTQNLSENESDDSDKDAHTIKKTYKLPPIEVLNQIDKDYTKDRVNKETAALKALAINETFSQFGIKAKVVNSIIGPSIMKFEIQAAPGTKVNSITGLENNLRLDLATNNMRMETPIPGKTLIGIEIANSHSETVSMREIIESISEHHKEDKLLFILGKNVLGQPLTAQLNKMPHLLIAGSTGSGKSVMINTLICSILLRAKPNEVRFIMIDPKRVELSLYSKIAHMLAPVISDMKQASVTLKNVVAEMEDRYKIFMEFGVRNIDGYNKRVASNKKMPYHVIVIDELADLMMVSERKSIEESITRITQMARAAGIHLIVATQRPSVDVITGTIKTNITARIAFAVRTGTDSRTILDANGAENLLGRGDMLFMPPNGGDLIRAQGAFMSDEEIENIIAFVESQQKPNYDERFYQDEEK